MTANSRAAESEDEADEADEADDYGVEYEVDTSSSGSTIPR